MVDADTTIIMETSRLMIAWKAAGVRAVAGNDDILYPVYYIERTELTDGHMAHAEDDATKIRPGVARVADLQNMSECHSTSEGNNPGHSSLTVTLNLIASLNVMFFSTKTNDSNISLTLTSRGTKYLHTIRKLGHVWKRGAYFSSLPLS